MRPDDPLPEVTDAHRRAAFEALRMPGWTFDAAMQNDTRRRVIEARATCCAPANGKPPARAPCATPPPSTPPPAAGPPAAAPANGPPQEPDLFQQTTP